MTPPLWLSDCTLDFLQATDVAWIDLCACVLNCAPVDIFVVVVNVAEINVKVDFLLVRYPLCALDLHGAKG